MRPFIVAGMSVAVPGAGGPRPWIAVVSGCASVAALILIWPEGVIVACAVGTCWLCVLTRRLTRKRRRAS